MLEPLERPESSCMAFCASMRDKYRELARTGDVSSIRERIGPDEVERRYQHALELLPRNYPTAKLASMVGLHYMTLRDRLLEDGHRINLKSSGRPTPEQQEKVRQETLRAIERNKKGERWADIAASMGISPEALRARRRLLKKKAENC